MQRGFSEFGKGDYAKYAFLKAAVKHVRIPDPTIEDLTSPLYKEILERAQERVMKSLSHFSLGKRSKNVDVEILSFPVALMLVAATKDSFIKKRYALTEAKQAEKEMLLENRARVSAIARNFGWKFVENESAETSYEFLLDFADYIRNSTHLREETKWKLVNRSLSDGNVYLTRNEAARLLSEEVRGYVEKRFDISDHPTFPPEIVRIADELKKFALEKIGKVEMEGFPKQMVQTAFPPCIDVLYLAFTSGRHLSHVGRFTLTSFLVNIGMPPEKVIEMFRNVSDFNERMTRYQVEHIAGEKGSRTRYIPPKCDTLKTHGVCVNPDDLCQRVRHPLSYYRRKLRVAKQSV
jgi:DNA primase large subunit